MRFIAVASAILITALFTASPASATLVGDTLETVQSTVKTVQDAVNDPPVPPTPSAPSAVPAPPPPPAPAPAPAKTPLDRAPAPSPASSGSSGSGSAAPSGSGVSGAAGNAGRNIVGTVTGAAAETVKRAPAPSGDPDGGPLSGGGGHGGQVLGSGRDDHASAPGAGPRPVDASSGASSATETGAHEARRAGDIASSTSLSVTAGKVVALQRWIAYVWPAIPLIGGEAGGPAARAIEAGLLAPAATAVGQLLLAAASGTAGVSESHLATPSQTAKDRYADLLGVMSTDWRKILYRIALAVLLALLAVAVWKDFRPALRPRAR